MGKSLLSLLNYSDKSFSDLISEINELNEDIERLTYSNNNHFITICILLERCRNANIKTDISKSEYNNYLVRHPNIFELVKSEDLIKNLEKEVEEDEK